MTAVTALYLHGLPGSFASEMEIVFGPGKSPRYLVALERLVTLSEEHSYDTAVLGAFDRVASAHRYTGPIRLVGFSLGAMPALRIAAARSDRIASLDLIAPAAPLQLGNFLDGMAGKPVFEAAQQDGYRLGLLTRIQSTGLKLTPDLIARYLFAAAPDGERSLMGTTERRKAFLSGMKHCLHEHSRAYKAELRAYVTDWSDTLPKVTTPVRIWQGTDDNWTPAVMARALSASLGGPTEVTFLNGLSHYGALVQSLPTIIAQNAAQI